VLSELFFFYFSFMIVGLSILVVTRRNPVHAVLWMLLLFFHIAGLYLFLNAELMAAIQVIVYAGAILVLFLFVVLLLDIRREVDAEPFVGVWPAGISLALAFFLLMIVTLQSFVPGPHGEHTVEWIKVRTHTGAIGELLYTEFLFPFEVASIILLVAVVGAIVLAKKKLKGYEP